MEQPRATTTVVALDSRPAPRPTPYPSPVTLRLLVVEDDESIGQSMQRSLETNGYAVDWCRDGATATTAVECGGVDLVLLDAGLPDTDGFSLCRWIREQHQDLPIILVTARDTEIDIVVGLDAGANDYVTKPFSTAVLLARVRAHLRDAEAQNAAGAIDIARLRVDPGTYEATVDGALVDLRRREFELLVHLARNQGKVITRERLMAEVWDVHWDTSSKSLDMHIGALRRKLSDAVAIVTVRGVGYRLMPP